MNHSKIGIVAVFFVSGKTGESSSLSEEQISNVDVNLYMPAFSI